MEHFSPAPVVSSAHRGHEEAVPRVTLSLRMGVGRSAVLAVSPQVEATVVHLRCVLHALATPGVAEAKTKKRSNIEKT